MLKILSLAMILCLCIVPADIRLNPPESMPMGGHVVVEVIDMMTHIRIPNVTVVVYEQTRNFVGYCFRTDEDMLVTEWTHYCNDELLLIAWHEDYYLSGIQYTIPSIAPFDDWGYFTALIGLFKKSINTTATANFVPIDESPIDIPLGTETDLEIFVTVPEQGTVFGMDYHWSDLKTDYKYSEGMVIISSNKPLATFCDYPWASATKFYYAFEIGRIYNDSNANDDGTFAIRVPITLFEDCEIGVSVIDTIQISPFVVSQHNAHTFSYINETLNYIGAVQVEYGYQPSYVIPPGYISLDDLPILWDIPENPGSSNEWSDLDLMDLYLPAIWAVHIALIVWVVQRTLKKSRKSEPS